MKFEINIVNFEGGNVIEMRWSWKEFWVRSAVDTDSALFPMIHHARMLKKILRDKLAEQAKAQRRKVKGRRAFQKFV